MFSVWSIFFISVRVRVFFSLPPCWFDFRIYLIFLSNDAAPMFVLIHFMRWAENVCVFYYKRNYTEHLNDFSVIMELNCLACLVVGVCFISVCVCVFLSHTPRWFDFSNYLIFRSNDASLSFPRSKTQRQIEKAPP